MGSTPKLAYLCPEFPGQTHIWVWREISRLRGWGVRVTPFSTRRPNEGNAARHAFRNQAENETVYLWPVPLSDAARAFLWTLKRPTRLLECVKLAWTLPLEGRSKALLLVFLIPSAGYLSWRMKLLGIHHLHVQSCAKSAVLAMMAKRLSDVPYSLTMNANLDWWGGAMREKFMEASFVATVAVHLAVQIRDSIPDLPQERVIVAPHGVDTEEWQYVERLNTPAISICAVGRLHPSKGHDILIRAVALLRSKGNDVYLTIAGEGPDRRRLENLIAELGLQEAVRLEGSISEVEVRKLLEDSDIFALASYAEPLGVACLEAMATGIATVGTSAGGVVEFLTDEVNGLLVPPGNPQALMQALSRLSQDFELRRKLGIKARETVIQKFDSRIGASAIYRQIFGSGLREAHTRIN